MGILSVAGREHADPARRTDRIPAEFRAGGEHPPGTCWGGLWGSFLDAAFFRLPDLGSLIVAGPLVARIVTALGSASARDGLGALGAGFHSMGIPEDSVLRCASALKIDKVVVVAHGYPHITHRARKLMEGTRPEALELYSAV
jgi:hypothetical protein